MESIRFTNKAKLAVTEKTAEKTPPDSKLRFVSFDIPERLRTNRDNFRRAIKRMGFVQIQKSLWVSNKNIGELIDIAAEEYKITDYVAYLVTEKTNIDQHIETILKDQRKKPSSLNTRSTT